MSVPLHQPPSIVHIGLDEAGSLTSEVPVFVMAAVVTAWPIAHRLGVSLVEDWRHIKARWI
jgi:hypothetical protein